ncbi:MAG: Mrp/NBP35 family ATP-binding protein [Clostridia bacterium]|nr:Mrp/NBP35 family ATP-binding protein [Clostridia bacterium]
MSENCTHDCSTCGENGSSRKESFLEPQNPLSQVKKVIGIVSGKGGVGKSLVTSMLSVLSKRKGFETAILDADITGPSIPKAFGISDKACGVDDHNIYPAVSKTGIKVMSINLLLEDETQPVIWRGPILAGVVKQFWTDVIWEDVDYMFVDMPPGTGDVPLTVFQSLPLDGIVIVTSPQDLVSMVVEKAVNMAKMMNVPILGMVENMSYFVCPDCKKEFSPFGKSKIEETAKKFGIDTVARIPINPDFSYQSDHGLIELFEGNFLDKLSDAIEIKTEKGTKKTK